MYATVRRAQSRPSLRRATCNCVGRVTQGQGMGRGGRRWEGAAVGWVMMDGGWDGIGRRDGIRYGSFGRDWDLIQDWSNI